MDSICPLLGVFTQVPSDMACWPVCHEKTPNLPSVSFQTEGENTAPVLGSLQPMGTGAGAGASQSTLVKPQFPSRGLKMLPAPLAPILSRLGPASYPPLASGRCLRERHLKPRHIWGFPVCLGSTYRERSLLGPAELRVREL